MISFIIFIFLFFGNFLKPALLPVRDNSVLLCMSAAQTSENKNQFKSCLMYIFYKDMSSLLRRNLVEVV